MLMAASASGIKCVKNANTSSEFKLTENGVVNVHIVDAIIDVSHDKVHIHCLDVQECESVLEGVWRSLLVLLSRDTLCMYKNLVIISSLLIKVTPTHRTLPSNLPMGDALKLIKTPDTSNWARTVIRGISNVIWN